ncbi:MAG: DUF4249 domain-containing protein [Saprospiraceae bacterium]|nr:DUF4249 domain-containing protein [Saprospiraceae bacterium]
MNINYIIAVLICTFLGTGCTEKLNLNEFASQPIVEAFLYAGHEIDSIEVRLTTSYAEEDSVISGLSDLTIMLEEGANKYILDAIGNGFYRYPIKAVADQVYTLRFEYNEQTVEAETYVPPLHQAEIETNRIGMTRIDLSGGPGGFGQIDFPDPIAITWDNSNSEHYYVSMANIETESDPVISRNGEVIQRRRRMITEPQIIDNHIINPRADLSEFGTYQIIVYRVGPEYVSLFESTGTTSISLNDPPTNVENGLGIFAGISTDTLYLEVEPL